MTLDDIDNFCHGKELIHTLKICEVIVDSINHYKYENEQAMCLESLRYMRRTVQQDLVELGKLLGYTNET